MPCIPIHLHVSTTRAIRAAADLVARCMDDRVFEWSAAVTLRTDGVAYVLHQFEDRIEVREAQTTMVPGGTDV